MIFDNMLNKIDSLILRQPNIVKSSIESVENELLSNSYQFGNNIALDLFKIHKKNSIFKVDFASLIFKNDEIDLKYSFEDYPLSFERALFFKKSDSQSVRVFSSYDVDKKKYNISTIDIIHKDKDNNTEILEYDLNKKKLKNREQSINSIDVNNYQLLLEHENKPEIKDFLLLTHDLNIESEPLYINFLETLHYFKNIINNTENNIKLKI